MQTLTDIFDALAATEAADDDEAINRHIEALIAAPATTEADLRTKARLLVKMMGADQDSDEARLARSMVG